MFQAHFVLSCPQPRVSHLFQEILFFYLIIPLMSIQSPITALLPPLCRCSTLPAQIFLDIHISHSIRSVFILLGFWHCLNSWLPKSCCPFCRDMLLTLLRPLRQPLFPTIDYTLLYSLNSFRIKMLRTERYLKNTFNWSVKILWAFQENKILW